MPKSILKDLSYYEQNKRKFNKLYNRYWKKIAGPNYIGLCSYLFQKFYDEWKRMHKDINPSVHDFAEYYISHINPVKSDSGLTFARYVFMRCLRFENISHPFKAWNLLVIPRYL